MSEPTCRVELAAKILEGEILSLIYMFEEMHDVSLRTVELENYQIDTEFGSTVAVNITYRIN